MGGKHDITLQRYDANPTNRGNKILEMGGIEGVQENTAEPKVWKGRKRGENRGQGMQLSRWEKEGFEEGGKRELGPGSAQGELSGPGQRDPLPPAPHRPGRAARPAAAAAPCPPRSRPRRQGPRSAARPAHPRRGSAAPRKAPDRSDPAGRALGPAATAPARRSGS